MGAQQKNNLNKTIPGIHCKMKYLSKKLLWTTLESKFLSQAVIGTETKNYVYTICKWEHREWYSSTCAKTRTNESVVEKFIWMENRHDSLQEIHSFYCKINH